MARRGSGERAREMAEMAEAIRFFFLILFLWKEGIGEGDWGTGNKRPSESRSNFFRDHLWREQCMIKC